MVCDDEKRSGFCEPCSVRYEDLKEVRVHPLGGKGYIL